MQPSIPRDPESLNSATAHPVFRAIQEALAKVREHSGANHRRHPRSRSTQPRSSPHRRQRRRLRRSAVRSHAADETAERAGLVGIGERVRTLGGSFDLDSEPGGPTTLSFTSRR